MNYGRGGRRDRYRTIPDQSWSTTVSTQSQTAGFHLPMIMPSTHRPTTTNEDFVSAHPPRDRAQHGTMPPPILSPVGLHPGNDSWTSYSTPEGSLHTGKPTRIRYDGCRCTAVERTSVFGRQTFPVLRSICSWRLTTYVGKPSAMGQPTRPTQPFIPSGLIDE